ncbi:DNA helicase rad5 [Zalaria obscura]|uniref:DNA helicase rad5 n=1 Tax=Zalaria obscura TaxID=2024903 RepID=A0ACC3SN89_9PEZI
MSFADGPERPTKKRRFFVEDSPVQDHSFAAEPSLPDEINALPETTSDATTTQDPGRHDKTLFDPELFTFIIGEELPSSTISKLQEMSGGSVDRAINMYFDGTWESLQAATTQTPTSATLETTHTPASGTLDSFRTSSAHADKRPSGQQTSQAQSDTKEVMKTAILPAMPEKRYVGALGVAGWTTKSGTGILRSEEKVKIERAKQQVPVKSGRGGKAKQMKRQDVIVRFTNARGEEVGRLERESAAWISTLIDQKVCVFEGHCIYAPDRVRVNDTVYLQLRCYMLRRAFEAGNFIKPLENNRQTGIFETKETEDERGLRLRQVALVKLFHEVNMLPSLINDMAEKHKREGILQAAEVAEQYEQNGSKTPKTPQNGESSPPSDEEEEGQELEQDQLDSLYKKAQSFDFDTPEYQPAETFAMDLRKYQRQALHWMIGKEKDEKLGTKEISMHPLWEEYKWPTKDAEDKDVPQVEGQDAFYVNPYSGELSLDFPVQEQNCLGGILADEMGLGKTIEMLSLVHSHTSEYGLGGQASTSGGSVNNLPRLPKNSSSVERAPCTTLVVAPMSLLAQWASEAEKASKPGTLKTLVYYGTEKAMNLQTLCCEANAANAPNVIITSYGVVLSEFNQVAAHGGNRGASGGLFSIDYFRVILDEAHMIKNRQSKTAKACYEIAAQHRWVLTGTPIVNRLEDLFSLVRFLRVEPWSNFSFWKTFITVPFESKDFIRALDVVQTVLEPLVLRRTKDMKTPSGEALVPLPPKTVNIEKVDFSKVERDLYEHIFARAKRTFNSNMEAGTVMKSYTTIFAQILRLRQSCDHPVLTRNKNMVAEEEDAAAAVDIANGLADDMDLQELIERFEADSEEQDASRFGANVLKQIQEEADAECPLCFEQPMDEQAVTGCWHSACKNCLLDYIEHQTAKNELPRCFNCREPITARDVFQVVRHTSSDPDDLYSLTQTPGSASSSPSKTRISLRRVNQLSSAKITALLTHLKTIKRTAPATKSVIFSQFTSFLDLLSPALSAANIPYLRFDGSMSQKARAAVLTEFANADRGCVLLLSLRAGGVGLNLTCAQRVFMMDPWWSFAVEAQAIDRVHRMGQTEEVVVTRFVVEGSIEEKMLRIQERKKFM